MTSLGLPEDCPGGVLVDLNVPRDNEFTLTFGPHVVPPSVAGQVPAKIAELLLKVTTPHPESLHQFVYVSTICRADLPVSASPGVRRAGRTPRRPPTPHSRRRLHAFVRSGEPRARWVQPSTTSGEPSRPRRPAGSREAGTGSALDTPRPTAGHHGSRPVPCPALSVSLRRQHLTNWTDLSNTPNAARRCSPLRHPGSGCRSHPPDCIAFVRPDRISRRRARLQPLAVYFAGRVVPPQVAADGRRSAVQDVGVDPDPNKEPRVESHEPACLPGIVPGRDHPTPSLGGP